MVCTTDDLSAWKDFPKGLKVLLLDGDRSSAAEIKEKLESMDYVVFTFCNEDDALSAISNKPESFHVAIVEVNPSNINGSFKFLETAKDLPTIMTSNNHCLSTMMRCIALGAVEFLPKPLSEDKVRNIWQHVVHKAFNAGGSVISESLKPVNDSVVSMLQLKVELEENENENVEKTENATLSCESSEQQSPPSDKYPAPATPQLKQGARLLDDGDCADHTNSSVEKESGDPEGECKSVETTCVRSEETFNAGLARSLEETAIKEDDDSADDVKNDDSIYPNGKNNESINSVNVDTENPSKASGLHNSCGTKVHRKKMKVDWTPELHKKFVHAVEKLGVDQAIPSRILELMKEEGLTRHNVASHLQKYRMHRRHILPKEDNRQWTQQRDQIQRSYYPHKPIFSYPPYSNYAFPPNPVYPMWGAMGCHTAGVYTWGSAACHSWPPTESWHWKPRPGVHADAWGCPVTRPSHAPYSSLPQNAPGFHSTIVADNSRDMLQKCFDLQPAEEVIDNVVKEAINKPWLPLPLGLKPPSTDGVLAELSRCSRVLQVRAYQRCSCSIQKEKGLTVTDDLIYPSRQTVSCLVSVGNMHERIPQSHVGSLTTSCQTCGCKYKILAKLGMGWGS